MEKKNRIFFLLINIILTLIACFYALSGVLKMIYPSQFLSTIKLLLTNLFSFEASIIILLLFLSITVLWEIFLGILLIFRIRIKKVLWAFLMTNILFTIVSYYLAYLNKLTTCGCLGPFSAQFYPYHLFMLHFFNAFLIISLFLFKHKSRLFSFS